MPSYRKLACKIIIPTTKDIMTVEESAAILMNMKQVDSLINPMHCLKIFGQPTLQSNTLTLIIEGKTISENLHYIENSQELGNQSLHPN